MSIDQASVSAALLAAYPDLDAAAAQALIEAGHVMDVPAGQKCPTCCGSFREVMWLLEGSIRIYRQAADGREVTLCHVTPGDLCPLSLHALFHGGVYAAEAHSETRLRGIAVPSQEMRALVDRNPQICHLLLKLLTSRLYELLELVGASVLDRLELRLACLLGQRFGKRHSKSVNITHQELANDLGCTREVVSRLLKGFERMGCIRLHRGQIELLSLEALARLSEHCD
jgi:CRP/FNR family transcriptional regulator